MAAFTVVILAVVLLYKFGFNASYAILQAVGLVSVAIMIGSTVFEKWLWKTKLGRLVGCPPDYSGEWNGTITRIIKSSPEKKDEVKIKVLITQNLLDIEWYQVGYNEYGSIDTESNLLFGEVIDNQRKWSCICGLYEVTRKDVGHVMHYGSQLVDVSKDGKTIDGSYCSTVGNVGRLELSRV
jgi:hypothetical protein